MLRLIFIVLIIWLAFYFAKQFIAKISSKETDNHDNIAADQTVSVDQNVGEDMVQCATCKVHLPRSEAFLVANVFYCSKAHMNSK